VCARFGERESTRERATRQRSEMSIEGDDELLEKSPATDHVQWLCLPHTQIDVRLSLELAHKGFATVLSRLRLELRLAPVAGVNGAKP